MFLLKSCVLSLCLSLCLAAAVVKNADQCKSTLLKVDQCVNKILLITNPELVEFDSKQSFSREYCEPFPAWVKCVNEYKTCLKSFQRTLFGMVVANFKKTHAKFCKNSESTQVAYKHARCIKKSNRESFLRIGDKLVGLADHVSDLPDINQVIPSLCCGARLLINRTEYQVNHECRNISGPDTGTFLMGIISSVLGDVLDLVCAKHPSVEKCYAIEGPLTAQLEAMQSNQTVTHRRVMQSVLAILQRLDSETADAK